MKQIALLLIISQTMLCACTPSKLDAGSKDTRPRAWLRDHANQDTARVLELTVRVNENRYTLNDLADLLAEQLSVTTRFDWDGLMAVGITPEKSIPIAFGDVKAERLLSFALWHMAPEANDIYPTYMLVDGEVVVGTNASLVRMLPQVIWPHRDTPDLNTRKNEAARQLLLTTLKNPAPNSTLSFDQAIDYVRQETGVAIQADWQALELVGVNGDRLVFFSQSHLRAETLLRHSLEQVSDDSFDEDKLSYEIEEGVVRISTIAELREQSVKTVEYDVRDLLERTYGPTLRAMYEGDEFALERLRVHDLIWRVQWLLEIEPGFHKAWPDSDEFYAMHESERDEMIGRLTEVIQDRFENTNAWLDGEWWVRFDREKMIVRTDREGHAAIEKILIYERKRRRARMLDFMREVEAARWLKKAVQRQREGDLEAALQMAEQAFEIDRGNSAAIVMRLVLKQAIKAEQDGPPKRKLLE